MIRMIFVLFLSFLTYNVSAAENDLYNFSWLDKDKEIYVLQNRKFKKDNRFYLTAGFGATLSGAFVDSTTMQARAGYFFTEEFGVEVLYASNSGEENVTAKSVRANGGAIPFRRIVNDYIGAMALWSPFYSKVNTFNSIIYIDWMLGLGFAKLNETNNRDAVAGSSNTIPEVSESHTGIMWNLAAKFYINQSWSIRTDLTGVHYQALPADVSKTSEEVYANVDFLISIAFDL